jgi:hypothetical protein
MERLDQRIGLLRGSDRAFKELCDSIDSSPASVIAQDIEEYIWQIVQDSPVTFAAIFGNAWLEMAREIGDNYADGVEHILALVDWDKVAERLIWDSHRWDSYLREKSDD